MTKAESKTNNKNRNKDTNRYNNIACHRCDVPDVHISIPFFLNF